MDEFANMEFEMNDNQLIKHQLISIFRYKCLAPVFCDIADCNYAVIKGEPLSVYAYKNVGERVSSDIDILISRDNIKKLEEILKYHGFKTRLMSREDKIIMLSGSHQTAPWIKTYGSSFKINLDVNFDIFWGEYTGNRLNMDEFLSDTIAMEIYGCNVKTLPCIKTMVQIILHHYKEMNSIYHLATHNCINYKMFKDVYYLWKNNQQEITPEKLYKICDEYKIIPYVFYILYYTNQIYNDFELDKFVEAFKCSEGVFLLDYYGLNDWERKFWRVDFKKRLITDNLWELIKEDLTENDIKKLERNRRIFG